MRTRYGRWWAVPTHEWPRALIASALLPQVTELIAGAAFPALVEAVALASLPHSGGVIHHEDDKLDHVGQYRPGQRARPLTPSAAVGLHQAIGNAAFSRAVAVQRVLQLGGAEARTLEALKHMGADVPEFFSVSKKGMKKKFGSEKKTWPEKLVAHQAALHACLVEMLESDKVFNVGSLPATLKKAVSEYRQYKQGEERNTRAVSIPLKEGEVSRDVAELYDFLRASNRVFPPDALDELARKANDHRTGFPFELRLAAAEIKRNEHSLVQLGALGRSFLAGYLAGSPTPHDKHRDGPVGADLVFWRPREDKETGEKQAERGTKEYDGEFVQAKSFKFQNLKENIEAAANQLAGLNATGRGEVAKDREISLRGSGHRGVIELEIWDGVDDEQKLASYAKKALQNDFVDLVRAIDGKEGQVYEYLQ